MATKRLEQREDSMGLSFLDVLCCGLGAAILLLLIVKHEGPILSSEQIDLMAGPKVQRLEKQLQSLAADRQALDMRLASLDAREGGVDVARSESSKRP